jgi:hypothetical protein
MDLPFLVLDLVLFLTGTKNPGKYPCRYPPQKKPSSVPVEREDPQQRSSSHVNSTQNTLKNEGDYGMVIVSG